MAVIKVYIETELSVSEMFPLAAEIGHALAMQGYDLPGVEAHDEWESLGALRVTVSDPDAAVYLRLRFDAQTEEVYERRMDERQREQEARIRALHASASPAPSYMWHEWTTTITVPADVLGE
jgi:hypothetical protein